ncbi:MAG TPA: flagellar basal body P-ring formation chaperone FlgA [Bryobacteraceae bacterium]|nr:flagellar basal body P-ring formation chaperone FlgA [Bryobacteraceae bacterium]
MKLGTLLLFGCAAWLAPAQQPACQTIENDRILGKDLAAALPAFGAIPGETVLGNSPMPGSRRVFRSPEIQSLARRYSIALREAPEVCFEWAMEPLDHARIVEAMRASLLMPDASIEIAEASTYPVPRGRVEFPRDRLIAPPAPGQHAPVLWRGDVIYGGDHRYAIWARVGISATCRKLVAVEGLKPGRPIESRQLREVPFTCFPGSAKTAPPIDQMAGLLPLRVIPAGAEVRPELLARPNDVDRGDLVQIEVRCGAARLALTAQALSGGRDGDTISVRNPDSKKIFQARVCGKGKAVVDASLPRGS